MIDYIPQLRLVLTGRCNGNCYFCHREGICNNSINNDMPIEIIEESARVANELNIPFICLTGGEPTIRDDLNTIIDILCNIYGNKRINLTTNGYNLNTLNKKIKNEINVINLSLASLVKEVNMQYQGVDPQNALDSLKNFPAKEKNINIVITRSNQNEINKIVDFCLLNNISITLIFELKKYSSDEYALQQDVLKNLKLIDHPRIKLKGNPIIEIGENCKLTIKHPLLNTLITRSICIKCPEIKKCYERICAVRVYPDSFVSPCLSGYIKSSKISVADRIKDIYERLSNDKINVFSFLKNSEGSFGGKP